MDNRLYISGVKDDRENSLDWRLGVGNLYVYQGEGLSTEEVQAGDRRVHEWREKDLFPFFLTFGNDEETGSVVGMQDRNV